MTSITSLWFIYEVYTSKMFFLGRNYVYCVQWTLNQSIFNISNCWQCKRSRRHLT